MKKNIFFRLFALISFFLMSNQIITVAFGADNNSYIAEINHLIEQNNEKIKFHKEVLDQTKNLIYQPNISIDYSKARIKKLTSENTSLLNKKSVYEDFIKKDPAERHKIFSQALNDQSGDLYNLIKNDNRFENEINALVSRVAPLPAPVPSVAPAYNRTLQANSPAPPRARTVRADNNKSVKDQAADKANKEIDKLKIELNEKEIILKTSEALNKANTKQEIEELEKNVIGSKNVLKNSCQKIKNKDTGLLMELSDSKLHGEHKGLDQAFKELNSELDRCQDLQNIADAKLAEINQKKVLIERKNLTKSENCLAVDVREKNKDGTLNTETSEQSKESESNCVTASFFVGTCESNSMNTLYCLKRCGGWAYINKGYSDTLSASEIERLLSQKTKENGTDFSALEIQSRKSSFFNVVSSAKDDYQKYLQDVSKKGYSYIQLSQNPDGEANLKKLENLAIELNKAAEKCEQIKNVSAELIADNKNSELKKLKKQSKEIQTIGEFSQTMYDNLNLNCNSSKSEKENEKIQAFNIRIGGFEEPVVPYKFVATNDNTNAGMLYFINKKGEKKQEKIIFENGRFYNDQVPAWSADLPASNNLMTIEQVHASHLGSDYCGVFTEAKKAANDPAAAPATAPAPAAAPAAK